MKPASPQSFWRTGQQGSWDWLCTQPPVPPAGEVEMRKHLGVWGQAPSAPRAGAGAGWNPAARCGGE